MPDLPKKKIGIVACSGEEMPQGTVTRLATRRVLEDLRPDETVTICLPLFLAGGEGDRAFAKFYPTIAVDGCAKRCAYHGTERYSNQPAASIVVDDVLGKRGLACPSGLRQLSPEGGPAVEAVFQAIAEEVDRLLGHASAQPETTARSQGCSCGSGVPVTKIVVNGEKVDMLALDPIMENAFQQGLRADGELPASIWENVRIYNAISAEEEALYLRAVSQAWQEHCARLAWESEHGYV